MAVLDPTPLDWA